MKILQGNCLDVLKTLDDQSINCIVTSPPYYGLRDYGTGTWVGGDPDCPHYRTTKYSEQTATGHKTMMETGNPVGDAIYKDVCPLCGAVRIDEQIGLEESPEQFIDNLVQVFRECRRVLKDDGTLWVNIGDSYALNSYGCGYGSDKQKSNRGIYSVQQKLSKTNNCKPKDLIGIPWMLAFALRNDGWYLRQDIIWHKPNPMPESVKDRCTKSHEYIFLLSKSPRYYFDHEQMQEDADPKYRDRYKYEFMTGKQQESFRPDGATNTESLKEYTGKRNKRDVWSVDSKYRDTDQEKSVRQGMHRDRGNGLIAKRYNLPDKDEFIAFVKKTNINVVADNSDVPKTTIEHWYRSDSGFAYPSVEDWISVRDLYDDWSETFRQIDEALMDVTYETDDINKNDTGKRNKRDVWSVSVNGFKEAHFATFPEKLIEPCILAGCPKQGIVLDPFCGSGTTGVVSVRNDREFVGIELNPEYVEMSERRINKEIEQGIQVGFELGV